jgi:hypothetical protein
MVCSELMCLDFMGPCQWWFSPSVAQSPVSSRVTCTVSRMMADAPDLEKMLYV